LEVTIAYPVELRERVVEAFRENEGDLLGIAELFSVGSATLTRWVRLQREMGSLEPRPHGGGLKSPIDKKGEQFLRRYLKQHPDAIITEMVEKLDEQANIKTSESAVGRALARMEITRKKSLFTPKNGTRQE
jgi:transposase